MKMKGLTQKIYDSWTNVLTGLGVLGKDKRMSGNIRHTVLKQTELETLYAGDDIARKFVDIIPMEAFRKGYEINGLDDKDLTDLNAEIKRLMINEKYSQAWKWARLYGGSGILIGVADGEGDLSKPLDAEKIQMINSLTVLHRWELDTYSTEIDKDLSSSNFGFPIMYQLSTSRATIMESQTKIHYTRIIRFDGSVLPARMFEQNRYWHDSVLSMLFNVLRNFNLAHDTLPNIVQEFGQGILKIKDVADLLAAGKHQDVINRLQAFDLGKSAYKTAVIDSDEDYQMISKRLAGLDDVMKEVNKRLVVATGMPHTVILGDSPSGGLSGKGESEKGDFFDLIARQQKDILHPRLEIIIKYILLQKNKFKDRKITDKRDIVFLPLKEINRAEEAEIHKNQAEADSIYLDRGVLFPSEVAISRFGQPLFSIQTEIDVKSREDDKAEIGDNDS